jgi:hypothetical protein
MYRGRKCFPDITTSLSVEISVVVESVKQTENGVRTGRLGVRTA